jgi:hypothetical protein
MTSAVSTASLYPVVREIDDEEGEYGTCCCIDGTIMSRFSLQAFPLPPSHQTPPQRSRSQSDSDKSNNNNNKSPANRAKRLRSAVQRARSEGALMDTASCSDTQTISTDVSTEAEDKKFEEAFVLTRQVSGSAAAACSRLYYIRNYMLCWWD